MKYLFQYVFLSERVFLININLKNSKNQNFIKLWLHCIIFLHLCLWKRFHQSWIFFFCKAYFLLLFTEKLSPSIINMNSLRVHSGPHTCTLVSMIIWNPMESSIANSNLARLPDSNLILGWTEVSHWMECSVQLPVSWVPSSMWVECSRMPGDKSRKEQSHEADVLA